VSPASQDQARRFDPLRARPLLQRVMWLATIAAVAYLVWRFDSVVVPVGADESFGLRPGERLLVDRYPREVYAGDYVFQVDAGGVRRLVRIEGVHNDAAHVALGAGGHTTAVPRESVVARVILIWPF
jgi:hypothetical protein